MLRLAIALFFVATTALADVRVIDSDTIDLDGQRIRLHGIDAPERKQPCYRNGIMWLCGQEASLVASRAMSVAVASASTMSPAALTIHAPK